MLVGTKSKIENNTITVSINNEILEQNLTINLLGLNINSTLNWKSHIDSVCQKLSCKVG